MSNTWLGPWYLITVPNVTTITTFFSEISQQILKMYEKTDTITQMWHTTKFYFMYISRPLYLIIVLNMKKIHLGIMEECVRTNAETD